MLINGALSCWNMKNSPAIWRLHRRTHRMTDCTFPLLSGRKTLQWNVCFPCNPYVERSLKWLNISNQRGPVLTHRTTPSATGWTYGSCAKQTFHCDAFLPDSSGNSWRSAAATYAAGQTSDRRRIFHISAGLLRRTGLVWRSWTRDSWFYLAGFMAAKQPRPQSSRLKIWGPMHKTILLDVSAERGRFEAAFVNHSTLCVSAVFAVAWCPSVRHVGGLYPHGWRYRKTSFSAR